MTSQTGYIFHFSTTMPPSFFFSSSCRCYTPTLQLEYILGSDWKRQKKIRTDFKYKIVFDIFCMVYILWIVIANIEKCASVLNFIMKIGINKIFEAHAAALSNKSPMNQVKANFEVSSTWPKETTIHILWILVIFL